jgi:holo-[acyl-carrier protein] synthase
MQIGIDLVKIDRIKLFIEKFGDKAKDRFLSKKEQKIALKIETIAGFWAAKEAASKALGTGIGQKCSFLDIKIKKDALNKPYIKFSKKIKKQFGIKKAILSITHEKEYAIAVVIIRK